MGNLIRGLRPTDTLRFSDQFGQGKILDIVDGTDLLDLTGFGAGIDTLAELDAVASITQVGAHTVIQFDGVDERITIRNFSVAQLGDSDFAV